MNMAQSTAHDWEKKSFPTCPICWKPLDINLYCLEDAFSALIIFVYVATKDPSLMQEIMEKREKFNQKRKLLLKECVREQHSLFVTEFHDGVDQNICQICRHKVPNSSKIGLR